MTIAAIYVRKSTEQTDVAEEARSVTRQVEHARAYAQQKGWRIAEEHIYTDDGISGAEFERRPGLQALLAALKPPGPPFEVLIVSEQSRLGRETIRTLAVIQQIQEASVRIFSYLDDREITLEEDSDEIQEFIRSWSSSQERRKASQRTRDALARKARAGHVAGGRVYGYANRPVISPEGQRLHTERVINEGEARAVRLIFERCAAGAGYVKLAHELNDARLPAPRPLAGRPCGWTPSTVRAVLFRELYLGRVVWGKTRKTDARGRRETSRLAKARPADDWIRVEAPELRIISDELWQAAHERLGHARRVYTRATGGRLYGKPINGIESPYLLTGLAACGLCGGAFTIRSRREASRHGYFYKCLTHVQRGYAVCVNSVAMPMEAADAAVLDTIESALLHPDVVAAAIDEAAARLQPDPAQQASERQRLQAELGRIDAELRRLVAAIAQGGELPALMAAVQERQPQRERLQERLATLDQLAQVGQLDGARLRRALAAKLGNWRGLLRRHVKEARQVLVTLLDGRLRFTPREDARGGYYVFEGAGRLEPVLEGVVNPLAKALVPPG